GGVMPYNYNWSTGESNDRLENIVPGKYSVYVTDANMCMVRDTVTVKSDRPQCLEIPNAFSPNGDGVNDRWEIGKIELYPEITVEIYNRWGELLFRSNRGYNNPWDGTHRGKTLPMDSYHYVIDLGNGTKPITGNVTIVR
ncbi:MAG: gliding motility-associated C-terminal domain-containing protein, partial [Bacteroidales bacterium]|nr:gliding motility-associated C-terminal domain-containing protein [Bacteroidales bacterium]